MGKFFLIAPLALLASGALPGAALAAEEDTQVWTALNASVNLGKQVVLTLEGQLRITDDANRLGQYLIRPRVGVKLNPNTTASLGYAYVHTDPVGPAVSDEHRLWQQVAFRLAGDGKGLTLVARSRLEQRWVEGTRGMGWRMRQQLRLSAPLRGQVRAVAWSEAFVSLNDTRWGQTSGLDRWRNFIGLALPVNPAITIEPGYLNQWVSRPNLDRVHHIASLGLQARF